MSDREYFTKYEKIAVFSIWRGWAGESSEWVQSRPPHWDRWDLNRSDAITDHLKWFCQQSGREEEKERKIFGRIGWHHREWQTEAIQMPWLVLGNRKECTDWKWISTAVLSCTVEMSQQFSLQCCLTLSGLTAALPCFRSAVCELVHVHVCTVCLLKLRPKRTCNQHL